MFHLYAAAGAEDYDPGLFKLFKHGEAGVDIFFVLSGFIIFFTASKNTKAGPAYFFKSRFWRIFPPYWAVLALYIAAFLASYYIFGDTTRSIDIKTLLASFALAPIPDQVIIIAWTLSLELIFYLVFGLSFFVLGAAGFFVVMCAWVAFSFTTSLYAISVPGFLSLPLNTIVIEFLFGSIIGYLYINFRPRFQIPALIAGCVLLGLSLAGGFPEVLHLSREIAFGLPAMLIVYGLSGIDMKLPEWVNTWGESSYILYLAHLLVYLVVGKIFEIVFSKSIYSSPALMVFLFLIATVTAYLANVFLERPYHMWYRRRLVRSQK
ncbi:hypothetical protein RA28_22015 [Ruegeria sp. ANG-S4]|nr:hypothetical protein RA28_22015 [Ruegeria sp. ANG-S4]